MARQLHEREGIGSSVASLAHELALEGKFPDAVARYNEAIGILREVREPAELGTTLLELGDAEMEQANVAAARKSYEEARMLNRQFPGGFAQPEIDLAFARLSLAGGQPADAAAQARAALNAFTTAGREGDRLQAAALLVRALISSGNIEQASAVLGQIPSPEGKGFPVSAVVHFRIARCLVSASTGLRAEAVRSMDRIAAEATRLGLAPLEKEARLAKEVIVKSATDPRHRDLSHTAFAH